MEINVSHHYNIGLIRAFYTAMRTAEARMNSDRYTVDQLGHVAGLPGWWTVLRNGNPVMHLPTMEAAEEWAQERCAGLDLTAPQIGGAR